MPLHPAALAALRWWRDSENGIAFYLGRRPLPSDPVFPSLQHGGKAEFSRPRSADKIRASLAKLELPTKGAKGKPITAHAARRTFLTCLDRLDVDERLRKMLAGHGISDVTHRHYTAEDLEHLRELAEAVARIPLVWPDPVPLERDPASVVPAIMPSVVPGGTTPSSVAAITSSISAEEERFELPVGLHRRRFSN